MPENPLPPRKKRGRPPMTDLPQAKKAKKWVIVHIYLFFFIVTWFDFFHFCIFIVYLYFGTLIYWKIKCKDNAIKFVVERNVT